MSYISRVRVLVVVISRSCCGPPSSTMASEDSSFDLQSLLADAQDLVDERFVARALLQHDTNPWSEVRP